MPRPGWLVLLCVLGSVPPAGAQVLSLDTAIAEAIARGPELRRAGADLDRAAAEADEARSARAPRLVISESWQRSNQPVFVFGTLLSARRFGAADFALDRLNRPDGTAAFTTRLGVGHIVFDGGRRRAEIDAAARGRDVAGAAVDAGKAETALEVTRVYGRILEARAAERATASALAAADEDLARAERRRDAGLVTEADVLALSVQRADLRQRALQARGTAETAMAELNGLRGAAIETIFDVTEPATSAEPVDDRDLASRLEAAETARAEVRQADARVRIAEARLAQARRGWSPVVEAQAAYEVTGVSVGTREGAWLFGGELRWSLNLGGAEAARIRAASAALASARAAADAARAAARVDVVASVRQLATARARAAAGEQAVRQARESQRIIRNRYEAGIASLTDMLRAVTAELDADRQRVAALVDVLVAEAALRRAAGRAPASPLQ